VAAFGSFISGYGAGVDGVRTMLVNVIGISQQPLIDLQQSIAQ
jgi:hypothetical protein